MGENENHECTSGRIRVTCPACGFSKEMPGEAFSLRRRGATCPKCASRFLLPEQTFANTVDEPQPTVQQTDREIAADGRVLKKTEGKPGEPAKGGVRSSCPRNGARSLKWKLGIAVLVPLLIMAGVFLLYCGLVVARAVNAGSGGQNLSQTIMVQPKGVFARIDTNRTRKAVEDLSSQDQRRINRAIEKIITDPGKFQPPAFFALAASLHKEGKAEEAIFWLNAGRVRARFDANRCADVSARQAVRVLSLQMPADPIKEQFKDLDRFRALVVKAIEWDRTTPYDYDHRWINLHGMGAMMSGLEDEAGKDRKPVETSLPEEQWPTIAKQTRENYLRELDEVIAEMRSNSEGSR